MLESNAWASLSYLGADDAPSLESFSSRFGCGVQYDLSLLSSAIPAVGYDASVHQGSDRLTLDSPLGGIRQIVTLITFSLKIY